MKTIEGNENYGEWNTDIKMESIKQKEVKDKYDTKYFAL